MLIKYFGNLFRFLIAISLCYLPLPAYAQIDKFIPYGTPNIDGNITNDEWSELAHIQVARFYGFDQFVKVWLQWDQDNLYIAGHLQDYNLFEDGGGEDKSYETYHDDSIEIYLHPGDAPPPRLNDQSRVLAFSITGAKQRLDKGSGSSTTGIGDGFPLVFLNDRVRFSSVPLGSINNPIGRDEGWQFEVALPWSLIGQNAHDGMPLRLNLYKVNDDQGGPVQPRQGNYDHGHPDGIQFDEWLVYRGDRYRPNQWANFILSQRKEANDLPRFESTRLDTPLVEGRRVRLNLDAPRRGNANGSAYRYLIRYQEGNVPFDDAAWHGMQIFDNAYLPKPPRSSQNLDIIGLLPNKTYTIAVRAQDETGRVSREILWKTVSTTGEIAPFVTVAPTGRALVLTDGSPFVVVGETGLMPWLPLRGLYTGDLCDEHPPGDPSFLQRAAVCGQGIQDKKGSPINGRIRNYSTEQYFYRCHMTNGQVIPITDTARFGKSEPVGPNDNCRWVAGENRTSLRRTEAIEGRGVAVDYFARLQAAGVNTLTVFVESLDLDASPILFEEQETHVFNFLDSLVDLAHQNDVYLIIRLYDTYYYKQENYPETGQKWARTQWAKHYGKATPEGFFDEDVYHTHLDRMNRLFRHVHPRTGVEYRNESHILGWDLVNEIDNADRFNKASYENRRKWTERMLAHAKHEAPRQLAFFSFLTWDPKDDDGHYRPHLGMDAELAYRAPQADMAVPHGYYARVSNPYHEPPNIDYEGPMELARGIIYGFHQIRDGRPIIDGESGPSPLFVEERNGYRGRLNKDLDMTRFMASAWLHFAAGGAGANLGWPIDLESSDTINQLPPEKRHFLKIFKDNVGDLTWRGDELKIAQQKIDERLVQVTRHDERNAVSFLYNQDKSPILRLPLLDLPVGTAHVKVINPRDGQVVYDNPNSPIGGEILLNNEVRDSVAVVVTNMSTGRAVSPSSPSIDGGVVDSIADRIWLNATFKIPDVPDTAAIWHFGGDQIKNGNRSIWGYLYADPKIFDWADKNNPEVFVKVWFDPSGRIDVNFFHVSGSEIQIEVLSGLKENPKGEASVITAQNRYARHIFNSNGSSSAELLDTPDKGFVKASGTPRAHNIPVKNAQIGAVIHTEDNGDLQAAWHLGGSSKTSRGDEVAWGFFYADPNQIGWGFENNPDVYVKVWYDAQDKRLDVNFFHVSVPNISVYSGSTTQRYDSMTQTTTGSRYTRHHYQQ